MEGLPDLHGANDDNGYDNCDNDGVLKACLICTPTFTHEEFIQGSLGGGKVTMIKIISMIKCLLTNSIGQAVFSEKPVSQAPSGTLRCYEKWAQ